MKGLSIAGKATRYDEALKEAVIAHKDEDRHLKATLERIFPELKESEDERIRKEILDCFIAMKQQGCFPSKHKEQYDSWINWLEKQGKSNMGISEATKQKLEDNLNRALEKETSKSFNEFLDKQGEQKPADKYEGLSDFEKALADICIGWIGQELGWKQYIKDNADVLLKIAVEKFNSVQDAPFEQKHAWSEEDEHYKQNIIDFLKHPDLIKATPTIAKNAIDWLKSLKDRYIWKPSNEQMNTLEQWLKDNQYKGDARYCYPIFESLYQDLKKLKV